MDREEEGGRRIPNMQALAVMRYLRCVGGWVCIYTSDVMAGSSIRPSRYDPPVGCSVYRGRGRSTRSTTRRLCEICGAIHPTLHTIHAPNTTKKTDNSAAEEEVNSLVAAAAGFRQPLAARPVRSFT